jgi:glycosyltransferase involved in cell wall biosynthesis
MIIAQGNPKFESSKTKNRLKVLFVSSGNVKNFDVVPFIKVQGESLEKEDVSVEFFKIRGKGLLGYLKNIKELRKHVKNNHFDIIHAHFTLSAWVAVLAFTRKPIVLSLMGTDAFGKISKARKKKILFKNYTTLTFLIQPFVDRIICKSPNIEDFVWRKSISTILPNGVDFEVFDGKRISFREELGLDLEKKYVLFLGNPEDTNKNFALVKGIEDELIANGFTLINPYPISHKIVPKYLSSVNVLALCSFQEGSPNVVKECMASNCKGVFTPVGDVPYLVKGLEGYEIADWNPKVFLKAILNLEKVKTTDGREALKEKGLDIYSVAKKLRQIYDSLLEN